MYRYRAKRKSGYCLILLWSMLLFMTAPPAMGQAVQSLEAIRDAVKAFLIQQNPQTQGRREISVGKLDARLRLVMCDRKLRVFKPPGSRLLGHTTVGVSCESAKPWKLYVPVNIRIYKQVLAARHYLPRGTVIRAEDLEIIDGDISTLGRGYFSEYQNVAGKVVKQALMAGKVINPYHIDNPKIVRRGESVTILASTDGFEIRMKGKAMMDGTSGDLIKVKNLKSRRIVEGRVVASGLVKVLF